MGKSHVTHQKTNLSLFEQQLNFKVDVKLHFLISQPKRKNSKHSMTENGQRKNILADSSTLTSNVVLNYLKSLQKSFVQ